jgi:hypothetical protein
LLGLIVGLALLAPLGRAPSVTAPRLDRTGAATPSRPPAGAAALAITGPLEGNVEPCGCAEGQLGGLARRASLFRRWRAAGLDFAPLDLGDVVLPSDVVPEAIELRARATYEVLAESGTRAVAVGELDLRLGALTLARLARDANVDLVSANLVDSRGERPFRASLDVGPATVTAVVDESLVPGEQGGVRAISAREAVERVVAGASGRVVVLFHGSARAAARTLGDVRGVELVVAGHDEDTPPSPPVGLSSGATLIEVESKGQRVRWVALPRTGPLEPPLALRLDGMLPDEGRARERLDAFYEKATELARTWGTHHPRPKPLEEGGRFVGTKTCEGCHPDQARVHDRTPHAHALERLREADPKRAGLAECIRCHSTGFGLDRGYDPGDPLGTAGLAQVSCEACHGVGSNHAEGAVKRGYGRPYATLSGWRERCTVCHDRPNSPSFDLAKYLERIKHWSDDRR